VLRLADENDYMTLGLPIDVLAATSPPGRGMFDEHELQVAVLGGSPSVVAQAQAIAKFGRTLRRTGVAEAPGIGRLPTRMALSELPAAVEDLAVIGMADDLQPLAVDPRGSFMVTGASGSGRTTALATFGCAVRRWRPDAQLLYVGDERSPLVSALPWAAVATEPGAIAVLAKDVLARIERPGAPFFFLVTERPAELAGEAAENVGKLIAGLRAAGHGVVGDGDAAPLNGFPNAAGLALRTDRKGFALQPDANDSGLFQAPFGSPLRADYPPGRGFFVLRGTVTKGHLAVPE
jgi:S-DNA-T family DNA segregation ATPase FtsK/SpoIIIE